MQNELKVAIDGSVFVHAMSNVLARTGVYFVALYLAEALADRPDVVLSIVVDEKFEDLTRDSLSPYKISLLINNPSVSFGQDQIFYIHPFYPAPESAYSIPNVVVVQIIHDLAFHACPELSQNEAGKAFERKLVSSINQGGFAICVSNATKRDLCDIFQFPTDRVGVFHPGLRNFINSSASISDEPAQHKNRYGIPQSASYVVALSTLEPRKNIEATLKIFELFLARNPIADLYLVFIGAQGWGGQMEKMRCIKPEILKKVRVLGYVSDEAVEILLRHALCLLYPSLYEGFGLPPLEALSKGTVAICSNRGSLPEILQNEIPVFDPFDVDGMAQQLELFYSQPQVRQAALDSGFRVARQYTWERAAETVAGCLQKFSSGTRQGAL